jgi:hypothetical protein
MVSRIQIGKSPNELVTLFIGFFIVFAIKLLLPLGIDESEHLHFSYLLGQNYTPYKDFYQHHLPLIWDLFSVFVKSDGFLPKIIMSRLLQSFIIIISGYFFSKSFDKNQAFCFFAFCLSLTLLNPIINYGDIRPELSGIMFFTISYFLLSKKDNNSTILLMPVLLVLGMLFTPRFIPIYCVISFYYIKKSSFKSKIIFFGVQAIVVLFFLIKYDLRDILFFVFESTSHLERTFVSIINSDITSRIMAFYILFFLIYSFTVFKRFKILSLIYVLGFCLVFIEKHPYFNQSTIYLHIISLYFLFNHKVFESKVFRTRAILLIALISFLIKLMWINKSENHSMFLNQISVYTNQIEKCNGNKVFFSFHKEHNDNSFDTHPLFIEDLSYFGFINDEMLTDPYIRKVINYTGKSKNDYIESLEQSCLVDKQQYKKLKNIIHEK